MNNDEYNHIETIRGKQYRYDPDFDAYYRVYEEHTVSKYLWIPVTAALCALCYYLEYIR